MPGTHRSLLQTGGRKESRFSSTQVLTLTGRFMATLGARSCTLRDVLRSSEEEHGSV